ncbi:MAG: hypothetical protein VX447_17975 [Pseudomonadota bacterium]|uniref:hypothetical protein n=1 Tax=Gallaecimonas pentaromativorans TaxID=584787 RepID=UPI00067F1241|nr:hypothetical protein [Gallaecimonas pentaromativorans]MED5526624.1 hypothetical protein [Pseudomonadota bacterium]
MLGKIKDHLIRKGTSGGPDFEHSEHYQVEAGSYRIDILQPGSIIQGTSGKYPSSVDLAHFDSHAVEVAREWRTGHRSVDIEVALWKYHQPKWYPIQHEPFALATATWKIEQLKKPLPEANTDSLEEYLKQDYCEYVEGDDGVNWHIRQKTIAFFATREHLSAQDKFDAYYQSILDGSVDKKHLAAVLQDYADNIDRDVESTKMHLPKGYQVINHNNHSWVRYSWSYHGFRPERIYYCTPLGLNHQLVIEFSLVRMLPGTDKYWLTQAQADFEKVVTGTTVQRLALPQD